MDQYIILWIETYGLIAIFCLMFSNGFFSFPPSEITLLTSGFLVSNGVLSFYESLFFAFFGNLLGTFLLYLIAIKLTKKQMDTIVHYAFNLPIIKNITKAVLTDASQFYDLLTLFKDKGKYYVLLYRCLPVVRSVISAIAGAAKMPANVFLVYSSVGIFIWVVIWQILGYSFGYLWKTNGYLTSVILLLVLGGALYITKKRIKKRIYKT